MDISKLKFDIHISYNCDEGEGCNATLEDDIFEFGKDMIKLSKNLDSLDKQEIATKIQAVVEKHCGDYLEDNDSIANLDEYDGLVTCEDDEKDEDEDEE